MRIRKQYTIQNSQSDLLSLLKNHKGNGFAHIIAKTIPAMNKKGNPYFGNLYKITDSQVQMGFHYINSVNNQLEREGLAPDAELKPRQWGNRINGTPLVEHIKKGESEKRFYLETKIERVNSSKFYTIEDNREIGKANLLPWLKKQSESSTQEDLTKKVYLRDYALDSIMWIRADNVEIDLRTYPTVTIYEPATV